MPSFRFPARDCATPLQQNTRKRVEMATDTLSSVHDIPFTTSNVVTGINIVVIIITVMKEL